VHDFYDGALLEKGTISLQAESSPTDFQGSYTREKAVSFLTGFTKLRESFGLVREVFL